jgi:hypothetical protein
MDDRYRAEMQAILAQFRQAIRREGNLPLFDHAAKQTTGSAKQPVFGFLTIPLAFPIWCSRKGRQVNRLQARPARVVSPSCSTGFMAERTLIGDPRSKQGRLLYQVTLDNGESRWAKRLNFAKLSCERKEKPRDLGGKRG